MTFELKIDGWMQPYEYRALSIMFAELASGKADDRKNREAADPDYDKPFVVDGAPTPNASLQTSTALSSGTLTNTDRAGESEAQHAARRERGKPAPGRGRRTKDEIAEDEAADKREGEAGTQAISTGGERVGPEDDAETQAQDRADEEAEEGKTEAAPLTIMDGKAAMGVYVNKFGMAAAQEDGMSIFISALGQPPAGAKGWGWTMLAEGNDQAKIDTVVKAWQAAAAAAGRFGA